MKKLLYKELADHSNYIQDFFDNAKSNDILFISKGNYYISPLFIKKSLTIYFEEGTIFNSILDETKYKLIKTRVAGIEMDWYPALLNIMDTSNVRILGNLTINGNGSYWWEKYWGKDMKGGMRAVYDKNGLRFACDYDCKRPRNLLVQNCKKICIDGVKSLNSGFWNIHILYSKKVVLNDIYIDSGNLLSPSTDGIDVDSSSYVTIKNCKTMCNDDSIAIKSGRDFDGLSVNKPSHHITINNCEILKGFGITLGSELSGGIHNVRITNCKFTGTDCGLRIKSSNKRKGYINKIYFNNINMINVKYLFNFQLNWNPNYNLVKTDFKYDKELFPHYEKLLKDTYGKNTSVRNIYVNNVSSYNTDDYCLISRAFNMDGFNDSKISNVKFKNCNIKTKEFGRLNNINKLDFKNCIVSCEVTIDKNNNEYDNR